MSDDNGPAGPLTEDLGADEDYRLVGSGDLLDRLVGLGEALAAVLTAAIMLSVVAGVIMRALFNAPMAWVIELSGAALLYITFLATAYLAKRNEHVRLEIIDEILPERAVRALDIFADLASLAVAAVLTYASAIITWNDFQSGIHTGGFFRVERWQVEVIIPVGSFLLVLQLVRMLVRRIRGRPVEAPKPTTD